MKIGVYSGSFDPVHAGHIAFALRAAEQADLVQVYFVPERRPANHDTPEHHTHRLHMLDKALRPYAQFHTFDLPDARLNARSLTRLVDALPQAELCLLVTADDILGKPELPGLYHKLHLIIAVQSHEQMSRTLAHLTESDTPYTNLTFVDTAGQHVHSVAVRQALRAGRTLAGLLPSVKHYAKKHWLYTPIIR